MSNWDISYLILAFLLLVFGFISIDISTRSSRHVNTSTSKEIVLRGKIESVVTNDSVYVLIKLD